MAAGARLSGRPSTTARTSATRTASITRTASTTLASTASKLSATGGTARVTFLSVSRVVFIVAIAVVLFLVATIKPSSKHTSGTAPLVVAAHQIPEGHPLVEVVSLPLVRRRGRCCRGAAGRP